MRVNCPGSRRAVGESGNSSNQRRQVHLSGRSHTVIARNFASLNGLSHVTPGVLLFGTNAFSTDVRAMAVMGYDSQSARITAPFESCDNHLKLAEALGGGACDLKSIEVVGASLADVGVQFPL